MISVRVEAGEETLSLDEFEARIRRGHIAPNTPVRFPVLTGERWVDARELELFRRLYEPARIHFSRTFSLRGFPIITLVLVLVEVIMYFGLAGKAPSLSVDALVRGGAKVSANIFELGETWRLWTANLLHRDVLHLLFNMVFLFNVGGTIENAYRKQDYALILICSALGTTLTSAFWSLEPSVGASGIVLGLFGAASVFGAKYADILPRRYRRYFGGAVLPYALFILYVGLATQHTDNWGHLGGLIAGAVPALFLEPKLLRLGREGEPLLRRHAPLLLSLAAFGAVFAAGPILRAMPPSLKEMVEQDSGLRVAYPARWTLGENHLGYAAIGNTLGATLGVRAKKEPHRPITLEALERRFLSHDLRVPEREGAIGGVEVLARKERRVDGQRAVELVVRLESRAGPHWTRNLLVARGYFSYAIVLAAPLGFSDAYDPLFEAMIEEIRFFEPPWLARSRALADGFPGMASAHVELGQDLASLGRTDEAAKAFSRALDVMPEQPDALFGLAKLAADYGGDLVAAEAIARRLVARRPEAVAAVALLATLEERLGKPEEARAVLMEAIDRVQDATELREQLLRLR
ncbi:MAG: rhomboid family intramembrane serine protease [Myxococcota bacterium]